MAGYWGTHEDFNRHEKITTSSDRSFGFVFAAFFGLMATASWWGGGRNWPWWLSAAAVMLGIALARPVWLAPLNALWTKLGLLLFKFVSPVALGLVYVTTIVPIGFFLRATRRDLLRLKLDREAESYWIRREPPGPAPDTMQNQF